MPIYVLAPQAHLEHELERKRSRFITVVRRVSSEAEARDAIAIEKDRFPDARHWCTAYAISVPHASPILHSSDDGEPSGTAGRPMLDVLTGRQLLDVVAIVTRYFGGTLLGTGGLVSAYSDSVIETLRGAEIFERQVVPEYQVKLRHADAGRHIAALESAGFRTSPEYLVSGVQVTVATDQEDQFRGLVASLTSGAADVRQTGETIVEVPAGTIP
ncbi:IMPACT family protein [Actinobaculum suis]|uniref:IMPACT family protein n=1 Tax=Actinobaculum suis TaxID=1657 RepID=UPI00066FCFA6|nr:YigZ family protein [Actinobaculum suis]KMY24077.1 IMPACT family member YigZ [Actinobaculum suis]OCA95690.1 IMPACT family protein [Actinobaculum suis]OCA95892.1 IMPACT family protein [Actinobaculum suis]